MSVTGGYLAEIVANGLLGSGSKFVFGLPGGGNNLDVVGAAESVGLEFILAHGETSAAIMASTYAEISGSPCACLVTRGPGAASAVNGLAQAALDRQPLILLTDTVSSSDWARISHQRIDQRELMHPVAKWSAVLGSSNPENTMASALATAIQPRPGPVHLDLDPSASGVTLPPGPPSGAVDEPAMAALIKGSRFPLIVVGLGVLGHTEAIRDLVAGSTLPVLETYKARGTIPTSSLNNGGLFTGATAEMPIFEQADLIVAIGLDAVELIPNKWQVRAPILSLNSWPEDSPYWQPELQYVGLIDQAIDFLGQHLVSDWGPDAASIRRRHFEDALIEVSTSSLATDALAPGDVVLATRKVAPAGSIATVDAGAHMLVAMPLWSVEQPNEIHISSGLATMGYSLPAAVATALANPGRRTFCVIGDGGLGMCVAELETLVRLNLPVTVVVFNDSSLSLIKAKQKPVGHGGSTAVSYLDVDFAVIAKGFGMSGVKAATVAELTKALTDSLVGEGPYLVDVATDPSCYLDVMRILRG